MVEITANRVIRQDFILDAVEGKAVLDIGCLAADRLMDLHRQIRSRAKTCIGMDIAEGDGVVRGDAQNFDFPEKFDIIILGEVIEHLGNVKGFFDSAARNLRSGGSLVVTTPNPYSLIALRKAIFGRIVPNDPFHVSLFDRTVLCNLLENYGQEKFSGRVMFYEERGGLSLPYRLNRFVSGIVPGYSCGILLDLVRA